MNLYTYVGNENWFSVVDEEGFIGIEFPISEYTRAHYTDCMHLFKADAANPNNVVLLHNWDVAT